MKKLVTATIEVTATPSKKSMQVYQSRVTFSHFEECIDPFIAGVAETLIPTYKEVNVKYTTNEGKSVEKTFKAKKRQKRVVFE